MPPCHRPATGVTLIELLVVITVIAVLAALLLPAIALARGAAHSAQCASNLRQLGISTLACADEEDGLLPYAQLERWPAKDCFIKPLVEGGYCDVSTERWTRLYDDPLFQCPAGRLWASGDAYFDYAPGLWLCGIRDRTPGQPRRTHLAELSRSTQVVLLAEFARGTPWWSASWDSPTDSWKGWTAVHGGRANFTLADGHVESHRYRGRVRGPGNGQGGTIDADGWDVSVAARHDDPPGDLIWSRAQLGLAPTW